MHRPHITRRLSAFDEALSVSVEELEIQLRGIPQIPWAEFLINPRRLRGSDFLMRWSQGVWSEKRIMQAVEGSDEYFTLQYGPSGTAPEGDVKAYEQYFLELENAGLGTLKRPDLLVFRKSDAASVREAVKSVGGLQRLPFTRESHAAMQEILNHAILALESENSLWRAQQMPAFGRPLSPQRRLGGKNGLPKGAVVPTIIMKEEDREPIRRWQRNSGIRVHVWHIFYDIGYGIAFDEAERLIASGTIEPTEQIFQAPNGITTKKTIYKIYYHHGYQVATALEEPELIAEYIADKNGHILPYVRFEGGAMNLAKEAVKVLDQAGQRGIRRQ